VYSFLVYCFLYYASLCFYLRVNKDEYIITAQCTHIINIHHLSIETVTTDKRTPAVWFSTVHWLSSASSSCISISIAVLCEAFRCYSRFRFFFFFDLIVFYIFFRFSFFWFFNIYVVVLVLVNENHTDIYPLVRIRVRYGGHVSAIVISGEEGKYLGGKSVRHLRRTTHDDVPTAGRRDAFHAVSTRAAAAISKFFICAAPRVQFFVVFFAVSDDVVTGPKHACRCNRSFSTVARESCNCSCQAPCTLSVRTCGPWTRPVNAP